MFPSFFSVVPPVAFTVAGGCDTSKSDFFALIVHVDEQSVDVRLVRLRPPAISCFGIDLAI